LHEEQFVGLFWQEKQLDEQEIQLLDIESKNKVIGH
jgi:hypothetical protein